MCIPLGRSLSLTLYWHHDGTSNELLNPFPEWIHWFLWCAMIQVILIHIISMECTHCKFLLMGNIPHVTSRDCLIDTSAYVYTLVKPNNNYTCSETALWIMIRTLGLTTEIPNSGAVKSRLFCLFFSTVSYCYLPTQPWQIQYTCQKKAWM